MARVPAEQRGVIVREAMRRRYAELAELAPRSLASHAALLHRTEDGTPIIPLRHHQEWVRIAEDRDNYRFVCVIAPPAYAKSTWFSMIYPTWRIGVTGGRIRIGLVSNTANLTYNFSRAIQRTIMDDRFASVYGVKPDFSRGWAQHQFWTTGSRDMANATLTASGIGGPLQGRRFDEIILDDPTTPDDIRSEQTMEYQRNWLRSLLLQRFPPGYGPPDGKGRMIAVMTRWGQGDLVETLVQIGFKIVTMPALGYWDRIEHEGGEIEWGEEPLWPEKETKEELLQEREDDPLTFELVKQGNPRVKSGSVFERGFFQHGVPPARAEFDEIIQYVDTASGKGLQRNDFFVIATLGLLDGGKSVWVLDIERGKFPAPEQERAVVREAEQWHPDLVCVEDKNEGSALYDRLIVSSRLPLRAVTPYKSKDFRVNAIENAYRAMRVFHPDGPRWVRLLEAELEAFPNGPHDDQVDAVAGAYLHTSSTGPRIRVLSTGGYTRRFR